MVVFAVDISRRMIELRRTSLQCGRRTLLSQQCNSISGMARLTSRQGHLSVQVLNAIGTYAVAPAFGLKSSPVLSIVCIITASLRATATAALLKPILSRSFRPHVRRVLSVELRVRMTAAAS
jgi:hypothetical protein